MNKLNIILLLTVLIMAILYQKSCKETNHVKQLYKSVNDDLYLTKNALGNQVATTSILIAEKRDLIKLNADNDSTLKKLQQLVKKQRQVISATVFNVETQSIGTAGTVLIDTLIDSLICNYPEYNIVYSDKWQTVNITANKDSINWKFTNKDEFHFVHKYKSNGLFKGKTAFVEVVNLNPNTTTTDLRTFTIPTEKKLPVFLKGTAVGAALIIALSIVINS